MKTIFKALLLLLLISMLEAQCFSTVRKLFPCPSGSALPRPSPIVSPTHPPIPPRPPVSSTTIIIYCVTTVQIFWHFNYGTITISVFVYTTCYTIIIHQTYWRNRCLTVASIEIDRTIGASSSLSIGGSFKIKSDFDKKGNLKSLE